MPSEQSGDDTRAKANFAYQASVLATATSKAYGVLFNAILRALLNKEVISLSEVTTVFLGAAAMIDAKPSSDDLQRAVHQHMRSTIAEAAQGFGIRIPPPGQTGIERTQ